MNCSLCFDNNRNQDHTWMDPIAAVDNGDVVSLIIINHNANTISDCFLFHSFPIKLMNCYFIFWNNKMLVLLIMELGTMMALLGKRIQQLMLMMTLRCPRMVSIDSIFHFIIQFTQLIYIVWLICFLLLWYTHPQRHEIHWQEKKGGVVVCKYYMMHVQTKIQYFINMKSCHLIFVCLSSL